MPRKPSRPCRYPGCPNFCEPGAVYCPEHMKDNSVNLREKWRRQRGFAGVRFPLAQGAQGVLAGASAVRGVPEERALYRRDGG